MSIQLNNVGTQTPFPPAAGGTGYQLPVGKFQPAILPGVMVLPLPDAEVVSTTSIQSNAYTSQAWELPIRVRHGAAPYYYRFMNAAFSAEGVAGTDYPTFMTLQGFFGSTASPNVDHGIIKWPSPITGTDVINIQAIDQEGRRINRTFTITTSTDAAVHCFFDVDAVGSANTGTKLEPYDNWTSLRTGGNGGKICYLRGSLNYFTPQALDLNGTNDPKSWIGYPGETVEMDLTRGNFNWSGITDDTYVSNIIFRHMPHYNTTLAAEPNTSITEVATGVYRVNKPNHNLNRTFSQTSIVEILGDPAGYYTVEFITDPPNLVSSYNETIYITIDGSDNANLNGTWPLVRSSWKLIDGVRRLKIDVGTAGYGGTTTVHGTSTYGIVTIYGAVDAGINGDYSIKFVDADNFDVFAATGMTIGTPGNSAEQTANPKMMRILPSMKRWHLHKVTWTDIDFGGWKFNDNSAPLFTSGMTGKPDGPFSVGNCTWDNATQTHGYGNGNGEACFILFSSSFGIIENCIANDITTTVVSLSNLKNRNRYVTMRNCHQTGTLGPPLKGWYLLGGGTSGVADEYTGVEVTWSTWNAVENYIGYSNGADYSPDGIHCYRCTGTGDIKALVVSVGDKPQAKENVITGLYSANLGLGTGSDLNYGSLDGITTASFIDYANDDYRLTDAELLRLGIERGDVGHEVIAAVT